MYTEILLAGNKQCVANSSPAPLSAEEEILRAKDRAYAPPCPPTKQQTIIKVFISSWIWRRLSNMSNYTEHGQLVIQMSLAKCEF